MNNVGWLVFVQRAMQAAYGLVTVLMITRCLSPEAQGWYYSFLSYASFYTLFDLGFSVALVPFLARFFSARGAVGFGELYPLDVEELAHELSGIVRWYGLIAVCFVGVVLPTGVAFFADANGNSDWLSWILPWMVLVVATGVMLFWMPVLALIEGAGYMAEVTVIRFIQLTMGSALCWLALYFGSGYWAAVALALSHILVFSGWFAKRWPLLLKRLYLLMRQSPGLKIRPKKVPWRVAVSWACTCLISQAFTLLLMHVNGAVVAGQFALTLSLSNMAGVIALSSMAGRVAYLGQAAARNDWLEIGKTLRQDLTFYSGFYFLAFVGACLVFLGLDGWQVLSRFLSLWQMLGLLFFTFVINLLNLMATYLHAVMREPFAKLYLLGTLFALPCAYVAAISHSSVGVVWVLVLVACFWFLPVSVWAFSQELRLARNANA